VAEIKTRKTAVSVKDFIATVKNETRRKDTLTLVKLFTRITGWKARMWGPTIIGFGSYHYKYESGQEGDSIATGFSPRTANLVLYVSRNFPANKALLAKLGKAKTGKSCTYVNKLTDIDLDVLEKMIRNGVVELRKKWPVKAS
jgi:Domain of unknown function (DU1801)